MQPETRNALLALVAIGLTDGVLSAALFPRVPFSPVAVGAALAITMVAFYWYRYDYTRHGYKRSPLLSIGVIGIPILALPYYLFRTRGLKLGALGTGCVLLAVVAYGIAQYLGTEVGSALRSGRDT